MDYRDLLKRYIDHVATEEGTTFINPWMEFSEEEKKELRQLAGLDENYNWPISTEPLVRSSDYSRGIKDLLADELKAQKYDVI